MSGLCTEPNKHTNKLMLVEKEDSFLLRGYHTFEIGKDCLHTHSIKFNLVEPYLKKVRGKSFLDLGGANGLYSFCAKFDGAEEVTIVDIDHEHLEQVRKVSDYFGFGINIVEKNITNYDADADFVLALALVHWIYSCTSKLGSLDRVIELLSDFTRGILLVEWIAPDDPVMDILHHTEWNKECITDEYTFVKFRDALSKHFSEVRFIGDVSKTRSLYLCSK